jgi:hypothetical protein
VRGQTTVEYLAVVAVVAALLAVGGVGVSKVVARAASASGERLAFVEQQIEAPLDDFLRARAEGDPRFDWSTDGCSAPVVGSRGLTFDFYEACLRHDFGYRNLEALGRFDAARRLRVDERFLDDMRASCARRRPGLVRSRCRDWALLFYVAVRRFGRSGTTSSRSSEPAARAARSSRGRRPFEATTMTLPPARLRRIARGAMRATWANAVCRVVACSRARGAPRWSTTLSA